MGLQGSASLLLVVIAIVDLVLLVNVPVVEDTEDVLAGAINGASKEEVGEAEVEVLLVQLVITILC